MCNSLAFRTSVLLHLLLDLDMYGGADDLDVFPLFLKNVVDVIASKLSIIFLVGSSVRAHFRSVGSLLM